MQWESIKNFDPNSDHTSEIRTVRFFTLSPEVAGGLGRNTVRVRETHPPVVTQLHVEFEGWSGDDLLEVFPCLFATERLERLLRDHAFSGFERKPIETTTSYEFRELYPNVTLPNFVWLRIVGRAGVDEIGVDPEARLVVSNDVLRVLRTLRLENCEVEEFVS